MPEEERIEPLNNSIEPDPGIEALHRIAAAVDAGLDPDDPSLADDWAVVHQRVREVFRADREL